MFKKIIITLLLMTSVGYCVDRAGQSDSLTRANFITAIYKEALPRNSNPSSVIDTASLVNKLDASLLEISTQFEDACQRKDTIITTAGTNWYSLNSDCEAVVHATVSKAERGIDSINIKDIGYNTTAEDDAPKFFAIWGTRIYLDRCNDTDTVFIYYQARANKLSSDTTVTNVRAKYFNLAVQETILKLFNGRPEPIAERILNQANAKAIFERQKLDNLNKKSIKTPIQ